MFFKRYKKTSSEELMILVQDKDHRAFSELYDRYATRLHAFFFRMLWSDAEAARDQVQELFTKLVDKPERYNPDFPFEPWLFRIASNICKNAYRKAAFKQAFEHEVASNGQGAVTMDLGYIDHATLLGQVHELLQGMDEDRRTIFLLRYQQDLSIRQIAEMFSMSEGTVKSKLFYTRERLKKSLIN